jgi:hypothetical protein
VEQIATEVIAVERERPRHYPLALCSDEGDGLSPSSLTLKIQTQAPALIGWKWMDKWRLLCQSNWVEMNE